MKKIIILLILLVPLYNLYSDNGYRKYLDTNKNFNLYDVSKFSSTICGNNIMEAKFIDSLNGIIMFNSCGDTLGFYKTTDGGLTWSVKFPVRCKVSSDSTLNLVQYGTNFFYIDTNIIVIPVKDTYSVDSLHEPFFSFLISKNSGESWQLNNFKVKDSLNFYLIYSRAAYTELNYNADLLKNGFGIGIIGNEIYKTDDYFYNVSFVGYMDTIIKKINSIVKKQNDIIPIDNYSICVLVKIINKSCIMLKFVVSDTFKTSTIYIKTNSNFNHFEYTKPDTTIEYPSSTLLSSTDSKAICLDSNKIWVIGHYNNNSDNLYHNVVSYTADFGKTWKRKFDFPAWNNPQFHGYSTSFYPVINFLNDSIGIIIGTTDKSIGYLTTDGGNTWKDIFSSYEGATVIKNLAGGYFKPDGSFIFSYLYDYADDIITYNPFIKDTIITSIDSRTEETGAQYFYAVPPFPMPANNYVQTTVYWGMGTDISQADVSIYNYIGEIVSTKEKININPLASYKEEIIWNCEDIPSGVYFINIRFRDFSKFVPVVVIR